jgi:hypothetical protein
MKNKAARHGYALVLVLIFTVLLLSLVGVAYRQIGSALRLESVRTAQVIRDEGSLQALARALALLGTGPPPSNPYVCDATINTSSGSRVFTITMSSEIEGQWTVHSAPTLPNENPDPMPETFLAP